MATNMLRSQKNQVFSAIKEAGLEPSDFQWSEVESRLMGVEINADKLTHTPTGYYFDFDSLQGKSYIYYCPGESSTKEVNAGQCGTWQGVLNHFEKWVSIVHREYSEPDLWEASSQEKKLIAEQIDDLDNTPFTAPEIQRIGTAINELRLFLMSSSQHTEAQRQFIETRLHHLEEASHRLGRKDWVTLAMGTLTNIVVGVALAPDAARELLRTAGALLGWVVGNIHLIP